MKTDLKSQLSAYFEEAVDQLDIDAVIDGDLLVSPPSGTRRVPGWSIGLAAAMAVLVVGVGSFWVFGGEADDAASTGSHLSPPSSADQSITTEVSEIPSTDSRSEPVAVPDGTYGDFGDQSWTMFDAVEATRQLAECLQDHGFGVTLTPPGDGIDWQGVPIDQQDAASAQESECRRSMAFPEFSWPTPEELRIVYEYNLALNDCLAARGHETTPPPSFEEFRDTYTTGPWTAYSGSGRDPATRRACPEVPPGGFGAWTIGDPIEPRDQ